MSKRDPVILALSSISRLVESQYQGNANIRVAHGSKGKSYLVTLGEGALFSPLPKGKIRRFLVRILQKALRYLDA